MFFKNLAVKNTKNYGVTNNVKGFRRFGMKSSSIHISRNLVAVVTNMK